MSNIDNLLELIKENHELTVIPMVNGRVIGDGFDYWIGDWGQVYIDEYLIYNGAVYLKSEMGEECEIKLLARILPAKEYEKLLDESKCRTYYDKLPWIKAIVVNIEELQVEQYE